MTWWGKGEDQRAPGPDIDPDRVCRKCNVVKRTFREMGTGNLIDECPRCGDHRLKTPGRAKVIDAINRAENVRKKL